jgi:hypothetical protein
VDRAGRDPGERALTHGPRGVSRTAARWIAASISALALLVLVRESAREREMLLLEADIRAATHAAGYLTLIAPPRTGRAYADIRLLSAANALASASFWTGRLQVWLDGTPLLPVDTSGATLVPVPLPDAEGGGRGAVAAWQTVPERSKVPAQVAPWLGLAAIGVAAGIGALLPPGRRRRVMLGVVVTIVLLAVVDLSYRVTATGHAATEIGLLRSRRMLEVTAVTRRLPEASVASVTAGWVVTPVKWATVVRQPTVTWDTLGASVMVQGARKQAWRLAAPSERAQLPPVWLRMILLGWLAVLGTFVAGALPPGEGYLSKTSRTPPTPP